MDENQGKIEQLLLRMNLLLERQDRFQTEITQVKTELDKLQASFRTGSKTEEIKDISAITETVIKTPAEQPIKPVTLIEKKVIPPPLYTPPIVPPRKPLIDKKDLEKFIGENLINKIGIVITVIGVGIGAKYAIDHQFISPLMRIIFGYIVGLGLLGFAIKLKERYDNFSAVLLSGAMAIMYLITFSAYSFYNLIPQTPTFMLMVLFTVFTVIAAINYNRQVIAHVGLVGAYAVPFLLSDGSGKVLVLFSYMAIINAGILAISFKKYWKHLLHVSFALTWLIFFSWYATKYEQAQHFSLAFTFLSIFYFTFYAAIMSYKLIKKEKFFVDDIIMQLANSFIFFGVGYMLLDQHPTGKQFLGLFTLVNAIIHFAVSVIIYRNKLADRNLFYLVSGLVLVFITIAIPVQLDGHWVTLLWVAEAALLFWIGRTKNVSFYELLSYPLMALAVGSLVQDWMIGYNTYTKEFPATRITPILNIHFLSSMLFVAAFAFINFINFSKKYTSALWSKAELFSVARYAIPAILLIVLYFSFLMEIASYWDQLYIDSSIALKNGAESYFQSNEDLQSFKILWGINYTTFFLAILAFLNIKKLKSRELGFLNLMLNVAGMVIFLSQGLFLLSELRDSYLSQSLAQYYNRGAFHLYIRYISLAFAGSLLFSCYRYMKEEFLNYDIKMPFDLLFHVTVLWVASSELINWMNLFRLSEWYKLELSILWGLYSLLLIALGIWSKKKHLRIGAIALFALTLVKLFFYDISQMETIAKTVVFVSLGILLLIISFLYTKYKSKIESETESQ